MTSCTRPVPVIVVGILHCVIGTCGVLAGLPNVLGQLTINPGADLQMLRQVMGAWLMAGAFVTLCLNGALVEVGISLLLRRPKARTKAVRLALASIGIILLNAVITLVLVKDVPNAAVKGAVMLATLLSGILGLIYAIGTAIALESDGVKAAMD